MALTKVQTNAIADDAVTTDKLANAINTERTANTAKVSLEDNAVTLAKMAGGTDGQIITYDASGDPVAVGPGTDGQVLTSTGAGSPPAFEALPASNNYTHPNHSGEVTSTADGAQVIASNVVDEDNLKISNAGSNGQYLQKQSGNTGGLTWADVSSSDTLSFRNLIVNGSMQVAQRSTSAVAETGYKSVDRWQLGFGGHDEALNQQQVGVTAGSSPYNLPVGSGHPYAHGFRKCFQVQNGNQTSGADAADYCQIIYRPEGQDINRSGWNYTDPNSKITLSFWIKSSVAQNFHGFIEASGPTRVFPYETGTLVAHTWTKVTQVIPGYASLSIPDTNASAFSIAILPFYGTGYTHSSARAVGSWYDSTPYCPDTTSTWWTTNDATLQITGVQLEVGDTASTFEHRTYGEELARCQRYYYKKPMFYSACMTYTPGSGEHNFTKYGTDHPVEMRSAPSFVGGDFACWSWSSATGIAKANITYSGDHGTLASSLSVACTAANGAAPANGPGSGNMVPCRQLDSEFNAEL